MTPWIACSKRSLCLLCGRAKGSRCPHAPGLISLFQGSIHHPPLRFSVGDAVEIQGQRWVVDTTNAGFSACSTLLRNHVARVGFRRAPGGFRKVRPVLVPEIRRQLTRIRKQYPSCLAARDPFSAKPSDPHGLGLDKLKRARKIAASCVSRLQSLPRTLHGFRGDSPEAARLLPAVKIWLRQLSYELTISERFDRVLLGTVTPAEIEALMATWHVVAV